MRLFVDRSLLEWDVGDGRTACAHRWYDGPAATTTTTAGVAADVLQVTATAHGSVAPTRRRKDHFAASLDAWRVAAAFADDGPTA